MLDWGKGNARWAAEYMVDEKVTLVLARAACDRKIWRIWNRKKQVQ
jgi:hypothetical protein